MKTITIQNSVININSIDYIERDVVALSDYSTPTPILNVYINGKLLMFKFFGNDKYIDRDNMFYKIKSLMQE